MMRVFVLFGERSQKQSGFTSSGHFPEVGSDVVYRTAPLGLH